MSEQQQFFFDDFFLDEKDPGIEVKIEMGGKEVPIFIKRRFTLEDIESARDKSIVKHMNFKTGEMVVEKFDDDAFTMELMLRGIVSWPFIRRDGSKVPVNQKTIKAMDSQLFEQLSRLIAGVIQQKYEQAAPFEKDSAEA